MGVLLFTIKDHKNFVLNLLLWFSKCWVRKKRCEATDVSRQLVKEIKGC
jgi:hypothetical protein